MKLLLFVLMFAVMAAAGALAGLESTIDCGHVAKDRCKSCCMEDTYSGYKWKKFGGSKNKVCVCVGASGTKDRAHQNDYDPGWEPYVPPPHLGGFEYHYGSH